MHQCNKDYHLHNRNLSKSKHIKCAKLKLEPFLFPVTMNTPQSGVAYQAVVVLTSPNQTTKNSKLNANICII